MKSLPEIQSRLRSDSHPSGIATILLVSIILCSCSQGNMLHVTISSINISDQSFHITTVFRRVSQSSTRWKATFDRPRTKMAGPEAFDLPLPPEVAADAGEIEFDVTAADSKCGSAQFGQTAVPIDLSSIDATATILLNDCDHCWCTYCPADGCSNAAPDLNDIKGTSADNIWAVGDSGTILRWDGAVWASMKSPNNLAITSLAIINDNDVWAGAGTDSPGSVINWNGNNWSEISSTPTVIYGISATNSDSLSVVGGSSSAFSAKLTKTKTQNLLDAETIPTDLGFLRGVWQFSDSEPIWAVGGSGNMGGKVPLERCPVTAKQIGKIIWKADNKDTTWTDFPLTIADHMCNLNSIWGSASDDIWAVGDYGAIMHYTNHNWQQLQLPANLQRNFWHVWGNNGDDVWAVGGSKLREANPGPQAGVVIRWSKRVGWHELDEDMRPTQKTAIVKNSVWGASGDDIWVVGFGGLIQRYRK